ncbi:MAG: glycosyltransferase family 2 protein [Methylocella sp.]
MKLSVIINNYNFGRFVGQAIDSALAIDWPDKEIIVVDDGSTDASRDIIKLFGDRVIPIFQANGGQNSACNAGFERSSGDVIIFLDSDDLLFPSVAKAVMATWKGCVAKVQYSLRIVDTVATPLGGCWPSYREEQTPERVRLEQRKTGCYLFPPTSGNAWARAFLEQVFPLPVRVGDVRGPRSGNNGDREVPVIDLYLSQLAPFFGDVVTIDHKKPQGAYRQHGNNDYFDNAYFDAGDLSLETYAHKTIEAWATCRRANELLNHLKIAHTPINIELREHFMRLRLICLRSHPAIHPEQDSLFDALRKYWRAVSIDEAPRTSKVKWIIWSILIVVAPPPIHVWAARKRESRSVFGRASHTLKNRQGTS